jgi:hypothetical protein
MKIAITVDVHLDDTVEDITIACEWLAKHNIAATFFISSNLFTTKKFKSVLRLIPALGHEVGSHSHLHNHDEYSALTQNDKHRLDFLMKSKKIYEDLFGCKPVSFRSPCWCFLSKAALDTLEELDYLIDSSSTPQRLAILTSHPYNKSWALSARSPYFIRPTLLEIPTSCFIVPASSMTFATLRSLSCLFINFLIVESVLCGRIINLQFHPGDFNPNSKGKKWKAPLKLKDFIPTRNNGFNFKHLLPESDTIKLNNLTQTIIQRVSLFKFLKMSDVLREPFYSFIETQAKNQLKT